MKFRLIISCTAALAAMAGAASAADVSPAGYDWTGFYAGVNAGVAWNNSNADNRFNYPGRDYGDLGNSIDGDQAAFTGGGMLGYNYQIDQFVLGAEADINYLGFSEETTHRHEWGTGVNSSSRISFDANWYGTLRGRVGFAADNLLFYGTGGLAYGHMSAKSDISIDIYDAEAQWKGSADSVNWGWTLGAGMEYGIDKWSLGVEYLFVDLGSAEWNSSQGGSYDYPLDAKVKGSVDYQFSVVRATAKLRF